MVMDTQVTTTPPLSLFTTSSSSSSSLYLDPHSHYHHLTHAHRFTTQPSTLCHGPLPLSSSTIQNPYSPTPCSTHEFTPQSPQPQIPYTPTPFFHYSYSPPSPNPYTSSAPYGYRDARSSDVSNQQLTHIDSHHVAPQNSFSSSHTPMASQPNQDLFVGLQESVHEVKESLLVLPDIVRKEKCLSHFLANGVLDIIEEPSILKQESDLTFLTSEKEDKEDAEEELDEKEPKEQLDTEIASDLSPLCMVKHPAVVHLFKTEISNASTNKVMMPKASNRYEQIFVDELFFLLSSCDVVLSGVEIFCSEPPPPPKSPYFTLKFPSSYFDLMILDEQNLDPLLCFIQIARSYSQHPSSKKLVLSSRISISINAGTVFHKWPHLTLPPLDVLCFKSQPSKKSIIRETDLQAIKTDVTSSFADFTQYKTP